MKYSLYSFEVDCQATHGVMCFSQGDVSVGLE